MISGIVVASTNVDQYFMTNASIENGFTLRAGDFVKSYLKTILTSIFVVCVIKDVYFTFVEH